MDILRGVMRLQAIAFAIYGLTFFFIPDFTLGTIFDWDTTSFWARAVGAIFIPLAWLEWNIAARLEERRATWCGHSLSSQHCCWSASYGRRSQTPTRAATCSSG